MVNTLRKSLRNSLRVRMVAVILVLAILPQIVVAVVVGRQSNVALEQQALLLQRRVAAGVSGEVDAYVREHENELIILDEVIGLGSLALDAQQEILANVIHSQRVFHELILVDRAGTERLYLSRTSVVLDSELANRADAPEFLNPLQQGRSYFGPVAFDEMIREPLMVLSIPLYDQRRGEITAVLIAKLRFKPVWDLLAGLDLPNRVDAYVLNASGQVIAHKNPEVVLSGQGVTLAAEEGRGAGLAESDMFLASETLVLGSQALVVVAEQPAASALSLARLNERVYLIVVLFSIVAAGSLSVLAANQIVRPIETLAGAARAMLRSDFSVSVPALGNDEIGELARTFNVMQQELQRVVTGLQNEVVERKQAEAAVLIANEQLREMDLMKTKFIDDISHELRTPVTNLKLYLDLLFRGRPENHPRYQVVLSEESTRLVSLCDGILDFSTLHKSLDQTASEPLNLNDLVGAVVTSFESLARSRGLDLTFEVGATDPVVWGHAKQLRQVIHNLLENAINYTISGAVRVSTHQASSGAPVRLTVADTGTGLDAEDLNHCFERFYRGRRVGQYNITPGVGLGLSKVKDIVEYYGGWVEVESEVDRGSTFSVYLPVHQRGTPNRRPANLLTSESR